MILELPFPPTLNNYRIAMAIKGKPRLITSPKGRQYGELVLQECLVQNAAHELSGPLACTLDLYPPTNARRDCDNYCKAVLDGLSKAKVYQDDSQIVDLRIRMFPKKPPGCVIVTLEPTSAPHSAHNQIDLLAG